MDLAWPNLAATALHLGWQLMIAIGIMVGALVLANLARRVIESIGLSRAPLRREVLRIVSSLAYFVILAMGAATALGTLGIDVAALVAGAGLAGLALGLALKDPIGNAVAGLMMLYFEPFRLGDRITILGIHGQVDDIDLRYTRIATSEQIVLVPNTVLLTSTISIDRDGASQPSL